MEKAADIEIAHSANGGDSSPRRQGTKRDIKSRHAQMIVIGGSIGTGLFVSTGLALATGGPAFLLAAYCISSLLVYGILTAIVEIATYLPLEGASMAYYTTRFISPSLGFALGWLYFYSYGILIAYEITAASIVINYWKNSVPLAVWITIMLVVIVALNLAPVKVYAESEFWFAGLKVVMICGLLILALVIMCGGGPEHDAIGFRYWNHPGATKEYLLSGAAGQFTAFLYVWIISGIAFYFTPESIIFIVGEIRRPRKNLPTASRRFFFRLVVFYILSVVAIGAICSSDAKGLLNPAGNANASPWVIGIRNAGIHVLPSIINAGILTSAWSAGNAVLYLSSRSLYTLAMAGHAPRIFLRCTRYGLPIYCVAASACFALLAYLNISSSAGKAFTWFISLTNSAGFISWIVCSICYLRFKSAMRTQNIATPYTSWIQPYASYICIVVFTLLLLCNGFTVFYPGEFTASGFLTTYIGIPAFLVLYIGHKIVVGRKEKWLLKIDEVDLVSGVRDVEAEEEAAAIEEAGTKPWRGGRWVHRVLGW